MRGTEPRLAKRLPRFLLLPYGTFVRLRVGAHTDDFRHCCVLSRDYHASYTHLEQAVEKTDLQAVRGAHWAGSYLPLQRGFPRRYRPLLLKTW